VVSDFERGESWHSRQVSEDRAKLLFESEDDSVFDMTIVDPGSSVSVRDKNNQVEYRG
jgi:hypothetical protein